MIRNKPYNHPDFSRIAFVYFDLDDTLIDHKNAQQKAMVDLWTHFPSLQQITPQQLATVFAETNARLWQEYRDREIEQLELKRKRFVNTFRQLDVDNIDWREADKVYMEFYQRHWDWIDDAREAFVRLSKRLPVGVLTNGFTEVQKKKFEHFSLHRFSSHLIISEEAGYLKPDTRIFKYAADKVNMDPSRLLYVGDSYSSDVLGGAKSGWKTAWYTDDGRAGQSCAADLSFSKFCELIKALS